jgi:hypothetical protein
MTKKLERKTVEIDRRRLPLRSLIHGKEIRNAAQALEDFRLKMNDKEILYGAKLYIDWVDYGNCSVVARRPETDQEYADRLERLRLAEEAKKERERKRQLAAEMKARQEEANKKAKTAEYIQQLVKEAGLSVEELNKLLTKV